MPHGAPHSWPLRAWQQPAVAFAVALQVFAVTRVSPWFPPPWCVALALGVGLAWLPVVRLRSVIVALAMRAALVVVGLMLAGAAIGELVARGVTGSLYPRASPAWNLAAAALWLGALHAPVTMTRWWVRASPSQDAALELAESLGASLIATVLALTVQNAPRSWSIPLGTAWSTGACLAVGLALFVGAWIAQGLRWRWLLRVRAGSDPAWHLAPMEAPGSAPPWTHAAEGEAPSETLVPRSDDGHYRAADLRIPAAGLGPRTRRAWWVRRVLNVVAGAFAFGATFFGMSKLMHIWSEVPAVVDPEGEALRAAERVGRLPLVRRRLPPVADPSGRPGWWSPHGGVTFLLRTHEVFCDSATGSAYSRGDASGRASDAMIEALHVVARTRGWVPLGHGWSITGMEPFAGHERLLEAATRRMCPELLSGPDD